MRPVGLVGPEHRRGGSTPGQGLGDCERHGTGRGRARTGSEINDFSQGLARARPAVAEAGTGRGLAWKEQVRSRRDGRQPKEFHYAR